MNHGNFLEWWKWWWKYVWILTVMTIWIMIFLSTASNCKIFVLHCNFQYPLPEPSNELADFARVKQQVWFHTPFSLKHRIGNFFCTRNVFFANLKACKYWLKKISNPLIILSWRQWCGTRGTTYGGWWAVLLGGAPPLSGYSKLVFWTVVVYIEFKGKYSARFFIFP